MIRRDCVHYHCEHDMGASIDCCTLRGLGNCPCSNDCNDYANKNEIYLLGLEVFKKRKEAKAELKDCYEPEQRWIPCDKGEPDEDMECWVTVKATDALYRGNFTKRYGERRDKGFITSGGFMWWNTVLAWMPIYEPEPYREEEQNG